MPKLDKKPLLNQNNFCDKWKIRLKKANAEWCKKRFFSTFLAIVNLDLFCNRPDSKFVLVWCLLSECHCLQATIPWSKSMIFMFATSNITKLFNSLSKRQVSTNLLPDLFRKRFCMAWRLHFLMFLWFLNILFYSSIFMLSVFDTYLNSFFNIFIKENHHSSRDI